MQSPKRLFFQNPKKWIVGPCRQCPEFNYCLGGCRAESFRAFRPFAKCYRASNPYCISHLLRDPNFPEGLEDCELWIPNSCRDCPLREEPTCHYKLWHGSKM